jgi:hypothetical protein
MQANDRGTKEVDCFNDAGTSRYAAGMWSSLLDMDMPVIAEDRQEDMQVDIECAVRFDKEISVASHDGRNIDTVVGRIANVNHQQKRMEMLVPEEYGLVHIPCNSLLLLENLQN